MERDRGSRWKSRLPLLVACAVVAVVILYSMFRGMGVVETWKLHRMQNQILEENARLREENRKLSQEVKNLRTNPAYIEEIARKELGLIGDKEKVIVLDRKKESPPAAPSQGGTGRP